VNAPRIELRPERNDDEPLLYALYASTREEEMALTGWDERTRAQFLQMQFHAQRTGYGGMFPGAQFDIVSVDGVSAGRIVVNRTAEEIRIVDLVLAPEFRARGIGTWLLRSIIGEAADSHRPLRLHVVRGNRALRFYQRLGFVPIAESPSHVEMERKVSRHTSCSPA